VADGFGSSVFAEVVEEAPWQSAEELRSCSADEQSMMAEVNGTAHSADFAHMCSGCAGVSSVAIDVCVHVHMPSTGMDITQGMGTP